MASKKLICNSCKQEVELDPDELDRHKKFWKDNTNCLTANFVCNKCLGLAKKGKIFETSTKSVEREVVTEVPIDVTKTNEFKTLQAELSNLWREYKQYVKQGNISEELVSVWRTKTETRLRVEGVSNPEFDIDTDSKAINAKKTLVYPTEFRKVSFKLPFSDQKVDLEIQTDVVFFE